MGQFESVLKGRGFSRAIKASKSIAALSRCRDVLFKLTHYGHMKLLDNAAIRVILKVFERQRPVPIFWIQAPTDYRGFRVSRQGSFKAGVVKCVHGEHK